MTRTRIRCLRFAVSGLAVLVLVAAPAANALGSQVDVLALDLLNHGAAVQTSVAITCDPVSAETRTYLNLTLFQGSYLRKNYVEGFGGIVDPTQPPIICDATTHEYSFTVTPTRYYADKRFHPGPATVEYTLTECTEVSPETFQCSLVEGPTRESVTLQP